MKTKIETIKQAINAAVEKGGKQQAVTLVAVSKTYPAEAIEEAMACGIFDFGENKVQELTHKLAVLPDTARWHLIGHLQTNKVKYIIGKVALIHSVDSLKLAEEIDKQSAKSGIVTPILIQVNVAKEPTKFGFEVEEVVAAIRHMATFKHVQIKGLMTIAPFVDDPEQNRPLFKKLFALSVDIEKQNIDNISTKILSMGMSNDYRVAIEEGATIVRVGTALFGQRDYTV